MRDDSITAHPPTRREALARLGLGGIALATGCTPFRFIVNDAPAAYRRDRDVTEPVLRLFVATVVPGIPVEQPGAADLFFDPAYPLTPHRAWLAGDLCARALRRFGAPFDGLPAAQRAEVIRVGLANGGVRARIYTGAVFLAQISVFSGISDPRGGCALIGFAGAGGLLPLAQQTYPDLPAFLPPTLTITGNPD